MSEFLTPPESAAMLNTLTTLSDVRVVAWGGYEDAERTAVLCAHAQMVDSLTDVLSMAGEQLVLLKISGNFEFDKGKPFVTS